MYHKEDIPFMIAEIPLTSKAYRIPAFKESKSRTPFKSPDKINSHPKAVSNYFPSFKEFNFDEKEYNNVDPF